MKVAFIVISCDEPEFYVNLLRKQVKALKLPNLTFYHIKNKKEKEGYAQGVNKGLRKALKDKKELFIISNPDISLRSMKKEDFLDPAKHFDIWGFPVRQNNTIYYGGGVDTWRMSAGLIKEKPKQTFFESPFVSGSLICVKKKVIDTIGSWDESYFLYYEDVDYCQRAKKADFKIGIYTKTLYDHFELSQSTNPKKEYYLARSRLMFLLRYGSLKQKLYELIRLPKTLIEERPFVQNFLILNFSSFFNKILNFVLFIFLIRYLSVQDYGFYTLAWAHVGLLQPFLDFGTTSYGLVYLPPQDLKNKNILFSLRVVLSFIVFVTTILLAYFVGYKKNLFVYIFLTSFTLFSNMLSGSLLIFSSIREKLILPSALSMVFNLILILVLIWSLALTQSLLVLFILIFIFYNVYSLVNFYLLQKEISGIQFIIEVRGWLQILKKSVTFLLISLFAGLYFKVDLFLLNFLKGSKDVGIYSSGYKFLEAFLFISGSYNFVSTPFLSKLKRKQEIFNLRAKIKRDFFYLVPLGVILSIFIFSISPLLLNLIFRNEYSQAIPVLRIVIFALPFIFATSIFFNALYVLRKAYIVVLLFIIQTLINVALNLIYIPQYSYIASSYITIIGELLNTVVSFAVLVKVIRNENFN